MVNTVTGQFTYIKVGTGTRQWTGQLIYHCPITGRRKRCLQNVHSALWLAQSPIQWVPTWWSLISQSGKGMHRKTTHTNHICALYSLLHKIPIPVNAIMPPFWKCEYLFAAVWKWQRTDSWTVSMVAYCWPHIRFLKIQTDGSQGCQFQTVEREKLPSVLLNPLHAKISSVRSCTVILEDDHSIPLTFVT